MPTGAGRGVEAGAALGDTVTWGGIEGFLAAFTKAGEGAGVTGLAVGVGAGATPG